MALNNFIYKGDFTELWIKFRQRGIPFVFSKLNPSERQRTLSAFEPEFQHANWWIIPEIKKRQNALISGNENELYESFISRNWIHTDKKGILISPGCGSGGHEIELARLNPNLTVIGYDISPELIQEAQEKVKISGIRNIQFKIADIYQDRIVPESVDYFLFHASLHHFKDIQNLLKEKIIPALKPDGLLFLNEFTGPNRMQYPDDQIRYCNQVLQEIIPVAERKILGTNLIKNEVYRQGKLRMIISDPSECVDSSNIIPELRRQMQVIYEKPIGGNILMPVLKHIAHHFVEGQSEILNKLFQAEDEYLKSHDSDFMFGVYQKK